MGVVSGISLTPNHKIQIEMVSVDGTGNIVSGCSGVDKKLEFASFFSGASITGITQTSTDRFTIEVSGGNSYEVRFPEPVVQMRTYTIDVPSRTWVLTHDQAGKAYSLTITKSDGTPMLARYRSTKDTEITIDFYADVAGTVNVIFNQIQPEAV